MSTLFFPSGSVERPRIAYTNLLASASATVSTDSEAVGFEFENLCDGLPFTFWKPATTGVHYVTAVFGSVQTVNFFAFYNQDLYENAGTISLQYSNDGVSWFTAVAVMPADNKPVYRTFTSISATRWRVKHDCTVACKIGVAAFGVDLQLERGIWIGFKPPSMNYNVEITTNVSESGTFLGRSLLKRGAKIEMALDHLTIQWVYDYWKPFMDAALLSPFFVRWNETDRPDEVIYAWLNAATDMDAPSISHHQTMRAGFKALGRVD